MKLEGNVFAQQARAAWMQMCWMISLRLRCRCCMTCLRLNMSNCLINWLARSAAAAICAEGLFAVGSEVGRVQQQFGVALE